MVYILAVLFGTLMLGLVVIGLPVFIIRALIPPVQVKPASMVKPYQTPSHWTPKQEERAQNVVSESPVLPFEEVRKSKRKHVLDKYADRIRGRVDMALGSVLNQEGTTIHVAGVVIGKREINSKAGLMATLVLDDPSGRAECIVYPMTYMAHPVEQDEIVLVNGRVSNGKLLVNNLEVLGKKRKSRTKKEGANSCELAVI